MATIRVNPSSAIPNPQAGDRVEFETGRYYWRLFPVAGVEYVGLGNVIFDGQGADIGHAQGMVQVFSGVYDFTLTGIMAGNVGGVSTQPDPNKGRGSAGFAFYGGPGKIGRLKTWHTGASGLYFGPTAVEITGEVFDIADPCFCGAQEAITGAGGCRGIKIGKVLIHDMSPSFMDSTTGGKLYPKEGIDFKGGAEDCEVYDFHIIGARTGAYIDGWDSTCRNIVYRRGIVDDATEISYAWNAERGGSLVGCKFIECISNRPGYYDFKISHSPSLVRDCAVEMMKVNGHGNLAMQILPSADVIRGMVIQGIDWGDTPENLKAYFKYPDVMNRNRIDLSPHSWPGFTLNPAEWWAEPESVEEPVEETEGLETDETSTDGSPGESGAETALPPEQDGGETDPGEVPEWEEIDWDRLRVILQEIKDLLKSICDMIDLI